MKTYITHRCAGSLHEHYSIRKYDRTNKRWELRVRDFDFEYWAYYMRYVGHVDYCPMCGKKLE